MTRSISRTARASFSGFQLFSDELLSRNVALIKRTSSDPELQQPVLEAIWKSLTLQRRRSYNDRARLLSVVQHQSYRRPTTADVVLHFLRKDRNIVKWANLSFLESLAHASAACLPAHQKTRLKRIFLQDVRTLSDVSLSLKDERAKGKWTNMSHFSNFTDMLRVLAPTRKILYLAVTASLSEESLSKSFLIAATRHYNDISEEECQVFSPIKEKERLKFERFCGLNCGGMNKQNLDIIALFAAFRGIAPLRKNPELDSARELYKSFLSIDHVHDSDFFRARRALARLEMQRSSEAGLYILKKQKNMSTAVSPGAYMIQELPSLDDTTVAEMLVSTRLGCSVYDDVLDRADILRSRANAKKLDLYRVRSIRQQYLLEDRPPHSTQVDTKLSKTIERFIKRVKKVRNSSAPDFPTRPTRMVKARPQKINDSGIISTHRNTTSRQNTSMGTSKVPLPIGKVKEPSGISHTPTSLHQSHTIVRMPPSPSSSLKRKRADTFPSIRLNISGLGKSSAKTSRLTGNGIQ